MSIRTLARIGLAVVMVLVSHAPRCPAANDTEQNGQAAEPTFTQAQVLEDLAFFLQSLEDIHPDPYAGFGGRVAFQLRAQEMRWSIPEGGMTRQGLYDLIRRFLGEMADGHTYVRAPDRDAMDGEEPLFLPLEFQVAHDAVWISQTSEEHSEHLGSRVVAVNTIPIADLCERAGTYFPAENRFAAQKFLVSWLISSQLVQRAIPEAGHEVALTLVDPSGATAVHRFEYGLTTEERRGLEWVVHRWDGLEDQPGPFVFQELPEHDAAYLAIKTVMAREAFEIMRSNGRQDLEEQLGRFYARWLNAPVPGDLGEAVAGAPSLTETVVGALSTMKEKRTRVLIVDLRHNGGGWSAITKPALYLLYGDRFFESDPVRYATRVSNALLQLFNTNLSFFSAARGHDYRLGDYSVTEPDAGPAALRRIAYLDGLSARGYSFLGPIAELGGRALYTPEVYVITDPSTFSAAFDMMFHLWRMGAKLVGVPPSQSANTFVDPSPFTLPVTKLDGAISRTAVTYEGAQENARAFVMDIPMRWEDYRQYGFDLHSEVLTILDRISEGDRRPTEGSSRE